MSTHIRSLNGNGSSTPITVYLASVTVLSLVCVRAIHRGFVDQPHRTR